MQQTDTTSRHSASIAHTPAIGSQSIGGDRTDFHHEENHSGHCTNPAGATNRLTESPTAGVAYRLENNETRMARLGTVTLNERSSSNSGCVSDAV